MLVSTQVSKTTASERLIKLYREQYKPQVPPSSDEASNSLQYYFNLACKQTFRVQTVNKIKDSLLGARLQHAGLNASTLYTYISNIFDLRETRTICEYSVPIYQKLLDIYEESPPETTTAYSTQQMLSLLTPNIKRLAIELEPELLDFQRQILGSRDWRAIGFLTTILNFNNQYILGKLQTSEKVLLEPYLRFVEEHIAIPWQRVCAAAAKYSVNDLSFILVEQNLSSSLEVAESVYNQIYRSFPHHVSKGGSITDPRVAHSFIRDLKMFQNYIWLCLLEHNMAPIEDELIDLCERVMIPLGVNWEMMSHWNKIFIDDLLSRTAPAQRDLLFLYTQGFHQAFLDKRNLSLSS